MKNKFTQAGFTLIETMVAISLLSIAIVAPMTLTAQSLASAYYARDQITAFYLAQEAIEALRSIRDAQILQITHSSNASSINIFGSIPVNNQPFTVDARQGDPSAAITLCSGGPCPPLQTNGTLYGYGFCSDGSCNTNFTRTVNAHFIKNADGSDDQDEVRITVTVTWQEGSIVTPRSFSISENLYRWVNDGSSIAS